jgi:hypothetical protein
MRPTLATNPSVYHHDITADHVVEKSTDATNE